MPDDNDMKNAILRRTAPSALSPDDPPAPPTRQTSRTGRVAVNAYVPLPVRNQLKLIAMQRNITVQRLFCEFINDGFAKHEMPEIAPLD